MPATDQVDSGFTACLAELMGVLGATSIADGLMDMQLFLRCDTLLDRNRTRLVQQAIEWEATHLLWLDADMLFPPLTVHRLLARNKDIVGANYTTRRQPHVPVALSSLGSRLTETPPVRCYTREDSEGVESVAALGFGCLLMRARVFDKVELPAFVTHFDTLERKWVGEDVSFAKKAREAGFEVFVDHDLSKDVRHAGRWEYTFEHANVVAERRIVTPTDAERDRVAGHLH